MYLKNLYFFFYVGSTRLWSSRQISIRICMLISKYVCACFEKEFDLDDGNFYADMKIEWGSF